MAKKVPTNDQGYIIKCLKSKRYNSAWEKVKYVGYGDEPDINKRFIIFKKACNEFDPDKNNNFILFYKNYINYFKSSTLNNTFYATVNNRFIGQLLNESISPSDDDNLKDIINQLKRINP